MNKKGIFFLSLLLIIIASIGIVSAESTSVEIGGIQFKIPSEYQESPNFEITNHTKSYGNMSIKENHKSFCDKNGNYLGISVDEFDNPVKLEELKFSGDEKTIGSQKGLHSYDNLNFFIYQKDNKIITVSYDDGSIIDGVIN